MKTKNLILDINLTPKIAVLFSMLEETRNRLLKEIEGLTQEQLDFSPDINKIETIGTLLYHIEAVEYSWIFEDIYKQEMPYEEWKYAFALRSKLDPPQLTGRPLETYVANLKRLRKNFFNEMQKLTDEDLNTLISSDKYNVTISWILYHLNQHESAHIGQINLLKRLYNLQ